MHPAISVILLTTLIGTGQGLFLALFTVQSYALVGLLPAVGFKLGRWVDSVLMQRALGEGDRAPPGTGD